MNKTTKLEQKRNKHAHSQKHSENFEGLVF